MVYHWYTEAMRKKEKSSYEKAKDKAWVACSIYVRRRDCLRFTGNPDEGMCVTCKRWYPFKKLQAGHFIPGRGNSVLFDTRIIYSQCIGCNGNPPMGKGGNYIEYFVFMEEEWGREKIDEFRALKNKTVKFTIDDMIEIERRFKEATIKLLTAPPKVVDTSVFNTD